MKAQLHIYNVPGGIIPEIDFNLTAYKTVNVVPVSSMDHELLSHYEIYRGIITQANDVTRHNNEVTRPNSEVTRRNNEATMLNDDVTRPGRKVNTDYSATFFTLSTDVEYIEQPTSSDFQTITET